VKELTGPIVLRGAGDLATGVAWRLVACGFRVLALELAEPLTVRRSVALSSALTGGEVSIEGLVGRRVESFEDAVRLASATDRVVPVLVAPTLPLCAYEVVVDARLAKTPLDASVDDATLVIGLGPGFVVGEHAHAVVETQRGPRLGRVLWSGSAEPNTGTPGSVGGRSGERVLRSPIAGVVRWDVEIGDVVRPGQSMGSVNGERQRIPVVAPFGGVVRGLITPGFEVRAGLKIGDVDPRVDVSCHEISDKALAIGGGVVEAVFTWLRA
jgi:xanthine dehydrogenase accessory factor